jgi:effector-binding domain-containing protein
MPSTKKLTTLSIVILLLAVIVFYVGFVPKTYEHTISLPYSMSKTGEQLNNPTNLVKWYLPFAGNDSLQQSGKNGSNVELTSGDYTLRVAEPSSIGSVLEAGYNGKRKQFLFNTSSDSGDLDVCDVKLVYKSTLFSHWTDKGGLEKNARQSLENLKNYMEDTRRFYGFEIEQTTVADTAFIFLSTTVPLSEKRVATKKLFEELIAYAEQKNGGYNGTRIFYSVPYGKDQTMLFASIGVSNMIVTPAGSPIQYKRMPFGKNLIAANYQGPYRDIKKAYEALENFKADHKLSSMAIPYQKFISEGYDFADDQVVQMKVYYPIF